MGIGDVYEVTTGDCSDLYYVDTGMYDVPQYGAVYILDADRPAIVDAGIGTRYENILDALDELDIAREDVEYILPTHIHLDHAGGAGYLAEELPNATVGVHEIGAPHLVDPTRLVEGTKQAVGDAWEFYAEPKPVPEDRIRELTDSDVIDLGNHTIGVHHAPGHAPHQVIFHDPRNDAVFTADAAGIYHQDADRVLITSPPPNFDLEQCIADVKLIDALQPSTLLYAHYGPAEADTRLEDYAKLLNEWVEQIALAKDELGDDEAVIAHFLDATDLDELWGERKARDEVSMNVNGVLLALSRRESAK
ncbi:MBL fold metallo-hydrolase [Haladaptatus sp. YSMS36]|uniref:MBL fold metallo-hydrolase n=1 Tax=Haladaptatus sp. YSMS36 TaxID=3033384 RepID=UPI0023E88B9F|nr:MBL fold metallo-hydrolase [Haladaptatus sp. YSMS36]